MHIAIFNSSMRFIRKRVKPHYEGTNKTNKSFRPCLRPSLRPMAGFCVSSTLLLKGKNIEKGDEE